MINSSPSAPGAPPLDSRGVVLRPRSYGHPDATYLVRALFDDQVTRYGYADPAEADPADFAPPEGFFLVAYSNGIPFGCGGYRTHDAQTRTIEVKKMYALPESRGTGLGRKILAELEDHAVSAGFTWSILETGVLNTAALALYTRAGYRPRPRYATGYRDPAVNRAFVKRLESGG